MVLQCINIRQVPWEVLKTAAFGLGFQHLPRDLANVNAWKTMFDPYNQREAKQPAPSSHNKVITLLGMIPYHTVMRQWKGQNSPRASNKSPHKEQSNKRTVALQRPVVNDTKP